MSYQVIARKYRPQRFSEVVGQDHVTRTLGNAIQKNRIAHAYLFVGPRGTGKTTIARIFAKCLNCTDGPAPDFPDDDPRCQEIAEGRSLDVMEIDGASNRGIDEIRELRETVRYAPANGRFKIYIIDEVHMLTKEAFNALLKTLEEPPAHVKFMFATTEPEKVLPTILSRCQRFDLRRIPNALIVKHLAQIATQESVQIEGTALEAIARGADGGMRDAESTLDQLISFCGTEIVEGDVLSMFGLTSRGQILDLANAILDGDAAATLRHLHGLAGGGKDLGRLLTDLLSHFRNLLVYRVSEGQIEMLEVSESERAALETQSARIEADALTRMLEILTGGEARLRDAPSRRIALEVTLLNALHARQSRSLDAVLTQLQKLRREAGPADPDPAPVATPKPATRSEEKSPAPQEEPPPPSRPAAPKAAPAPTPKRKPGPAERKTDTAASLEGPELETLWTRILEATGRASPFVRSHLLEAHPISLARDVFTVGFDPEFASNVSLVDNAKHRETLQTKLAEAGHPHCQVRFVVAEAPPGRVRPQLEPLPAPADSDSNPEPRAPAQKPSAPPEPIDMDQFRNDPLIQKALEIFKGQIVDVRG